VHHLEALEAVTTFSFLSDHIQDRVDQFSTFSVMTLGPVVTGTTLAEHKVIRSEELTIGSSSNRVHGSRFQVHQHSSGDITASSGFIEIDIDPFQLQIRVTGVGSGGVNTMFI